MADGTITIDIDIPVNQAKSDISLIDRLLSKLGKGTGEQMDADFEKSAHKMESAAKETGHKLTMDLREVKPNVKAKLDDSDVKNKIKKIKDDVGGIPKEKKTKIGVEDGVSPKLPKVKKGADETTSSFGRLKATIAGTFMGSLASNAIGALTSSLKEAAEAGADYNKEQDTMVTVWTSLTTQAPKDGKQLVNFINDVSQHSIYAADTVNKMAQSFYHVHSNVAETKSWTDSFIALGSTMHMTNEQLAESSEMFAKIEAGGKASAEDLDVMINRFPMFGEAIQEATGKSMKQLREMSQKGTLTADEFTKAIDYLGKKYKGGTEEAMTSFQGMSMFISSHVAQLSGNVQKGFFEMAKGSLSHIRDLVSDKSIQSFADGISKALAGVASGFNSALTFVINNSKAIGLVGNVIKHTFDAVGNTLSMFAMSFKSNVVGVVSNKQMNKNIDNLKKSFDAVFKALEPVEQAVGGLVGVIAGDLFTNAVNDVKGLAKGFNDVGNTASGAKKKLDFSSVARSISTLAQAFNVWYSLIGPIESSLFEIVGIIAKSAFETFADVIGGIGKGIKTIAEKIVDVAPEMNKTSKGMDSISKHKNTFKALGIAIGSIATAVLAVKTAVGAWTIATKIATGVQAAFNIILSANPIGLVIVAIGALVIGIHEAYKHFKPFREMVDNTWGSLKKFGKIVSDVSGHVVKEFKKLGAELGKKWNSITKTASDKWSDLKDTIIDKSNKAYDASNKKFNSLKKTLSGTWSDTRNIASDKWESLRSTISSISESTRKNASGKFGRLRDSMGSILRSINNNWHSVWNNMAGFFDGIWNRIKGSAKSGLNHVIDFVNGGIGGINGVVHFFGGKKQSISPIKKLAKGGRIINSMTALVNDEEGSIYREAIFRNNGAIEVPNERNVITQLNPGDAVMPAKETAKFLGLPMYKSGFGDWIGKAAGFVGNVGSDIGNWLSDKFDELEDAIKDPLSVLTDLFKRGHNNAEGVWHDFASGTGRYLPRKGVSWFKGILSGIKRKYDSDGGNPTGSGVKRWRKVIKHAANMLHQNLAEWQINNLLKQIQTESGGNPTVVQKVWDVNMANGNPAQGLLQFIPQTFSTWAIPGHRNIKNGLDQILAAIRRLNAMGTWNYIGHGHGWQTGGHIWDKQLAWLAEDGDEFVINSRRDNADNLLLNAIAQRASVAPNSPSARLAKMVDQTRFSSVNGYGISVPSVTGQQSQALTLTDNDNIDYTSQLKSIDSKLDDIMQKKVFIDGSSFSKSYERYGAVERTRRNTMMERGMSIDSRI